VLFIVVDVEIGGILINFILICVCVCVAVCVHVCVCVCVDMCVCVCVCVLSSLLGLSHADKYWILCVDGCV
jgi:hypothetical protein